MFTTPLLARVVELHQSELRAGVARDNLAKKAIVGTRTRGGFLGFAVTRTPRAARVRARSANPRLAVD